MTISDWIEDIRSKIPEDIPIILLANKTDLDTQRVIPPFAGQQLAIDFNLEFFETSAKTGENIQKSFQTIVDRITEQRMRVMKVEKEPGWLKPQSKPVVDLKEKNKEGEEDQEKRSYWSTISKWFYCNIL